MPTTAPLLTPHPIASNTTKTFPPYFFLTPRCSFQYSGISFSFTLDASQQGICSVPEKWVTSIKHELKIKQRNFPSKKQKVHLTLVVRRLRVMRRFASLSPLTFESKTKTRIGTVFALDSNENSDVIPDSNKLTALIAIRNVGFLHKWKRKRRTNEHPFSQIRI